MTTTTITNLQEFAAEYSDRYFQVNIIPSVGSPSYFGAKFKDEWLRDPATGEPSGAENFKLKKDGCEFGIGYEIYILKFQDYPQDEWGNIATQQEGLELKEGYYEVIWHDDQYSDFSNDFVYPDWFYGEETEDDIECDFKDWFLDNYQNYYFISSIEQEDIFGGTANSWLVVTTIKPFNSKEWLDLFEDFKQEIYE